MIKALEAAFERFLKKQHKHLQQIQAMLARLNLMTTTEGLKPQRERAATVSEV